MNGSFNLVGVWCHGANSPTFGYIGQFWKYLQLHKRKLKKAVIAGDFNSNVIWDKWDRWWNHSDVVRELKELGIKSLYHEYFDEKQGKETRSTLYLQRNKNKPYHIDYIFADRGIAKKASHMKIGRNSEWLRYGDHMLVIVDLDL